MYEQSLYAKVNPVTKTQGVLDAAIWVGYPWADEPRNHAVVMVTGDNKDSVKLKAEYLAESFWDVRDKFEFIAPTTILSPAAFISTEHPKSE